MKQSLVLAILALSTAAAAPAARAQVAATSATAARTPARSAVRITPYVGYMMFGDYLSGPLGTSFSNRNGAVYGAQLGVSVTRDVSLVGNVGYARSSWDVRVPIVGGVSVGDASLLLYDAGLQYRVPMGGASRVTPLVQVGAGAIRYGVNSALLNTTSTKFAANAGVGVDVALGRSAGLTLMARDYIGKFDAPVSGVGVRGKVANSVALSAGVTLAF